jgi:hypothetical protein
VLDRPLGVQSAAEQRWVGSQEEGYIHVVRAGGLKQADMYDGSDPYVSAPPQPEALAAHIAGALLEDTV